MPFAVLAHPWWPEKLTQHKAQHCSALSRLCLQLQGNELTKLKMRTYEYGSFDSQIVLPITALSGCACSLFIVFDIISIQDLHDPTSQNLDLSERVRQVKSLRKNPNVQAENET